MSTVSIYGGGALAAIWLSSVVVGAVNSSIFFLPKFMELVGLAYTDIQTGLSIDIFCLSLGEKELAEEIEALKKQITGTD